MIKVGIIGATGYAGSELVRLITQHPKAELVTMTSQSYAGQEYKEVYSNYSHLDYVCEEEHIEEMAEKCDVIFLALPHGVASKKINADILSKTKIIDLGADLMYTKNGILLTILRIFYQRLFMVFAKSIEIK